MWQIGSHTIHSRVVLAPMAGVSDLPFRQLCRAFGAGLAASEMLTSDTRLWQSRKSSLRIAGLAEETAPRVVQIAGNDPRAMAEAARACVERGAQIIDINMGCPAKKVCRAAAGSALLRDEPLVGAILDTVVQAVAVPVTLKMRTGWCPDSRNALKIGVLAESLGVQAITLHGRTRACGYHRPAEYATIAGLVSRVKIPVIANGDIDSVAQALRVREQTGCTAVMIGRAAHGQPWLLADMAAALAGRPLPPPLTLAEKLAVAQQHLSAIHRFYGDAQGVRVARKHIAWYGERLALPPDWRSRFNRIDDAAQQRAALCALSGSDDISGTDISGTMREDAIPAMQKVMAA